ncbi:MAG TPA: sulfotransferase domain-containing protein [Candidatus Limnocylindrales bacterium]|nr:sulfotransferase domain-containing protein [Candidatus Limnocylindrales bacterium]
MITENGSFAGKTVVKNLPEAPVAADASFPSRVRPVWIASYPRSGNTFLRIILLNLFHLPTYSIYNIEGQGFPDPSAAALDEAPIMPRNWRERLSQEAGATTTLIKTHDPPEGSGPAIYVVRDGRAAVNSYYYYHKKFAFEKPSLTEVIAGACQFGRWNDHYLAWRPRIRQNTLFLRYEELVTRPDEIIPKLSQFLRMEPKEGRIPTFEELKQQMPTFFRRGQNDDFLSEWTPGQMALFNELHGPVMKELDYPLASIGGDDGSAAAELAQSAAHWHELYLEKLQSLGSTSATCLQLYRENEELGRELRQFSEEIEKKDAVLRPLLKSVWVKVGMSIGLLRRARKAKRRLGADISGSTDHTSK